MELDRIFNYSQTNISKILSPPKIENNNFTPIISQYDTQMKNNFNPDEIPIEQKNIFKINDYIQEDGNQIHFNQNNKEIQDSDEEMHDESKTVEITASGNVEIKNNKSFLNKNENNIKFEDNNNYLDFDNKAESISMTNNEIFINNSSNNKNYDFMLQDNPINMNDECYISKWRKLYDSVRDYNNKSMKNNILSILEGLIIAKKMNEKNKKIEIVEINYNDEQKTKKIKSRNENNNSIKNSIKDSIDTKTSYDNLTRIITTTEIKNLSNSINSSTNSNLIIQPPKIDDEEDKKNLHNNYQETDISKILILNNIFNPDKFDNLVDFLQYKDELYMKKLENNSSNVRISLDNSMKKKDYGNIYTINEEDNESYDSLSLQKTINNSKRVTPSKLDLKKNSFKDIQNMFINTNNYNLDNFYNHKEIQDISLDNIINKNKKIEEIKIGNKDGDIEDNEDNEDFIINDADNDLNTNINYNIKNNKNEKKILSIDLDLNVNNKNNIKINDYIKKENNGNIEDNKNNEKMIISDNANKEHEEKENLLYLNNNQSKEKSNEKIFENISKDNNIEKGIKELINFGDNTHIKSPDFSPGLNKKEKNRNEEEKLEEKENEKYENEESLNNKEKDTCIQNPILAKSDKNNDTSKENIDININKLKYNNNENNNIKDDFEIKDNNIIEKDNFKSNSLRYNNNYKIESITHDDKNNNNYVDNKININNETGINENNNINISKKSNKNKINVSNNSNKENINEKIIISSSIIQNNKSDSFNDLIISPKSSTNNNKDNKNNNRYKRNRNNNENKIYDLYSNHISLSSNLSDGFRQNLFEIFSCFKIIDKKNRKILFQRKDCENDNDNNICIKKKTYEIPLFSYYYILQLFIGKKIGLNGSYELFIKKLMYKLEKDKFLNTNKLKNKKNNQINADIYNFEQKLKNLRIVYKNLIEKRSFLKTKKEKEKLMKEFDIIKSQNETKQMFLNLLFIIKNDAYNENKYNLYKEKIMNILKRYHKINKNQNSKEQIELEQKKLSHPLKVKKIYKINHEGNVNFNDKNMKNIKNKANKKIFFMFSFMIPFFYIIDYISRFSKIAE